MLTFYVKKDAVDQPEEISMEELTAYEQESRDWRSGNNRPR